MRSHFFYYSLRAIVQAILSVYFRRIEIVGAANVPSSGPVIFAANHPQSITDALVLSTHCHRTVHYLAHSGLFKNRVRGWLLRQLGVIPVYRKEDIDAAGDRNIQMFSACHALLARGGAIGIFPEGVSLEERRVQTLKTGTARIALESEANHGWSLGVRVVPVGLNFESTQGFRSRVLVSFGEAIESAAYHQDYMADPFETIHQLTAVLQERIRVQVVNIEQIEFDDLVKDLELMYKGELLGRRDLTIPGGTQLQQEQRVSREIAQALDYFSHARPVVVWRIRRHLEGYRHKLRQLHLQDEQMREHKQRTLPGEMARLLFLGALGLPLALYGAVWNIVPYRLTGWIARHYAKDQTQFHLLQLIAGTAVSLLYYVPLAWLAYRVLGTMGTTVFAASLPATGLFARAYAGFMGRRRRMLRFAYVDLTHRYAIQRLRQVRARLIVKVDAAFDEYVAVRDAAKEAQHLKPHGGEGP